MKKSHYVFVKIVMLLVSMPFLMGQQECPKKIVERMEFYLKPGRQFAPTDTLYVSSLTFMNAVTHSICCDPTRDTAHLLNNTVQQVIQQAQEINSLIKLNELEHTLPDTLDTSRALHEIIYYDFEKSVDEKHKLIVQEWMNPYGVDVLVGGMYIDTGQTINIRLFVVDRHRKIIDHEFTFSKDEFICEDPETPGNKFICSEAIEELYCFLFDQNPHDGICYEL